MSISIDTELEVRSAGGLGTTDSSASEILGYDSMEPFLMTLASDSDLWMFVSSLGSVAAGRTDEDHSLFPYCVEDMIHRAAGRTGPRTAIRIWGDGGSFEIWEPFLASAAPEGVVRKLAKGVLGEFIEFEERHERLRLTFRYRWATCDAFGFVRTSELIHDGLVPVRVDIVDGVLNLLPPGITYGFLLRMSVLVNAYTECEVDAVTGVTTVSLASLIIDRPEPGEALHASVIWSHGLEGAEVLLSEDQMTAFRRGQPTIGEKAMKGRRANYLLSGSIELAPGESRSWDIVLDTAKSQTQVESLRAYLSGSCDPRGAMRVAISVGAENLSRYIAAADGRSCTADEDADRHHQACVLFNIMRGGIFAAGDEVSSGAFARFVSTRNRAQADKHGNWLAQLPSVLGYEALLQAADAQQDPDLLRIAHEYLPLTFSRRHGDPSRPWNRFTIRVKNPDGTPLLAYEGNWRDIFQNWEALSLSYPMFIEGIIAKFVNASTVNGFNSYRITQEGIDWEKPIPDDPWSSVGYWGDHQIIYLLKFLEQARMIHPKKLASLLDKRVFSYANVPLRLRPYEALVRNPHSTMDFDAALDKRIEQLVALCGTDAKLLGGEEGEVCHVGLAEKLLVPALAKLSNLVLDAGIWMNTQRPEWNDANNALVGNGVSMVTLCYLRRYLAFCRTLFQEHVGCFEISIEVAEWVRQVIAVFVDHASVLDEATVSDQARRALLDDLGRAYSCYREKVYASGFSGNAPVDAAELVQFCDTALTYLDHSIRAARRDDGLYHAYNLVDLRQSGGASISCLYEMLEGQVAVLSAGILSSLEVHQLIRALSDSALYCPDRETFLLYPNRRLPGFLEKNVVPAVLVEGNPLLAGLIEWGDTRVIEKDAAGRLRFAPSLHNASALLEAINVLAAEQRWALLADRHRQTTLDAYEAVFGHRFFTGRSGSMYGYEGLGSIYWHMVSKLLVAVSESFFAAERSEAAPDDLRGIAEGYYRIRNGMGFNKTAHEFGAFPSDPYSHTPAGRGAKQPGMTGQSKEDILCHWIEFGVFSSYGRVEFRPSMLRRQEFLIAPRVWPVLGLDGEVRDIELPSGSLGFTVCGVPVVYRLGNSGPYIDVATADGADGRVEGTVLPEDLSRAVYARSGIIRQITVWLTEAEILPA